jgi:hypothetical protein
VTHRGPIQVPPRHGDPAGPAKLAQGQPAFVAATVFTDSTGAWGDNLALNRDSYAELSPGLSSSQVTRQTADMLDDLPYITPLQGNWVYVAEDITPHPRTARRTTSSRRTADRDVRLPARRWDRDGLGTARRRQSPADRQARRRLRRRATNRRWRQLQRPARRDRRPAGEHRRPPRPLPADHRALPLNKTKEELDSDAHAGWSLAREAKLLDTVRVANRAAPFFEPCSAELH